MSVNILLIEYEQSSVDGVRSALAGGDNRLEVAGDPNAAVDTCAHFEPKLVIITSALPNLEVADAITQVRARAGLRVTPFLVLMSGYDGGDSKADAESIGAQDILARPFEEDELRRRVTELVEAAAEILTTQAVPQETIEALRRAAGEGESSESFSSDDLFAEILSDVEAEKVRTGPSDSQPPSTEEMSVDDALADMLGETEKPEAPKKSTADSDIDAMLSETLSGIEISRLAGAGSTPSDETPEETSGEHLELATEEPGPVFEAEPESAPVESEAPPQAKEEPTAEAPEEVQVEDEPETTEKEPVDEAMSPEPSGTTFGQYVLEEHVATGGMAQVYKARMLGLEGFQKTVAIKRILPHLTDNEEFVKMFVDEAKLAAQLNHKNIIHIYDLGKIDRSHFIAMEYIEGRDLRSILDLCRERGVSVPISISLFVTNLLAGALDYAHKKRDFDNRDLGLVHRDVSPQNVMISTVGDIKLCDFGIAKAASKASHTRAGALKGKLQYMSPEQAWGKDIDHRSDVFSLGIVLYEMLTTQKVFAGDSELSILEQVRNPEVGAPSALVPAIPEDVDEIVAKALMAERTDRYQSAQDFQRDCEAALKEYGWEPDTEALVRFITELESGAEITDEPAVVVVGLDASPAVAPETPPEAPSVDQPSEASTDQPEEKPEEIAEPVPLAVAADDDSKGPGKGLWIAIAAVVVIALIAGWWFLLGPGAGGDEAGTAPTPAPAVFDTETTPTPSAPDDGMLSEAELLERAREVASAEMAKQEEELRQRLEEEFPTPTPLPPTATPTATPTETPTPSQTPTSPPPTRTRIPPTATPIPNTPTPVVNEGDIVMAGPDVVAPVLIHKVNPEYPPVARRAGVAGEVIAQLLVGINGTVEDVRIHEVSQKGVGFEKAAEDAVRQWRYRPATKHGVKVRVWVQIKINLTLTASR